MDNTNANYKRRPPIHLDELLTVQDLQAFKAELLTEIKTILKKSDVITEKQWLRSSEVRKMLKISAGTLQSLRIRGKISFSKIGGIVFYKYDDIIMLLEVNQNTNVTYG